MPDPKKGKSKQPREQFLAPEELAYDLPLSDSRRQFVARCPDGVMRSGYCGVADTFFTIPARMRANGRQIAGFLTYDHDVLEFVPTGKNKGAVGG